MSLVLKARNDKSITLFPFRPLAAGLAERAGAGQQAKAVAPVPERTPFITQHEGAQKAAIAEAKQFANRRRQQRGADAPATLQRTHEDPCQVRPAEASQDAIRRRRLTPVVGGPVARIAVRQQSNQDCANELLVALAQRDKARLFDQRSVPAVATLFQGPVRSLRA